MRIGRTLAALIIPSALLCAPLPAQSSSSELRALLRERLELKVAGAPRSRIDEIDARIRQVTGGRSGGGTTPSSSPSRSQSAAAPAVPVVDDPYGTTRDDVKPGQPGINAWKHDVSKRYADAWRPGKAPRELREARTTTARMPRAGDDDCPQCRAARRGYR